MDVVPFSWLPFSDSESLRRISSEAPEYAAAFDGGIAFVTTLGLWALITAAYFSMAVKKACNEYIERRYR